MAVYGQSAAREAFLRLQDQGGADVPMLLWCLWSGSERLGVPRAVMIDAVTFSKTWRHAIVDPLRALRRSIKPGIDGVPLTLSEIARGKVAKTEQEIERLQMDTLAFLPTATGTADGAALIALYAEVAGLSLAAADVAVVVECA